MQRLLKRLAAHILMAVALAGAVIAPMPAMAEVDISIGVNAWNAAPPPLPVYEQPVIPGAGYIWTPGYWAISPAGYYWVPGAWVLPPYSGAIWTPGYWEFVDGVYIWHPGYWSYAIGYYGGVNYGFGYFGWGYFGGYWRNHRFFYNRACNSLDGVRITNVYERRIEVNRYDQRHISFNGGRDGIQYRPSRQEMAQQNSRHSPPTSAQQNFRDIASRDRAQFADQNQGRPPRPVIDSRGANPTVPQRSQGPQVVRPGLDRGDPGSQQRLNMEQQQREQMQRQQLQQQQSRQQQDQMLRQQQEQMRQQQNQMQHQRQEQMLQQQNLMQRQQPDPMQHQQQEQMRRQEDQMRQQQFRQQQMQQQQQRQMMQQEQQRQIQQQQHQMQQQQMQQQQMQQQRQMQQQQMQQQHQMQQQQRQMPQPQMQQPARQEQRGGGGAPGRRDQER